MHQVIAHKKAILLHGLALGQFFVFLHLNGRRVGWGLCVCFPMLPYDPNV